MKKIFILFALLAAALIISAADVVPDQILFSNHGWFNLTEGYTRDTTDGDPIKSEIAVSGKTVHVVWADRKSNYVPQADGYDVWYRRSVNGGASWEEARSLYKRRSDDWNGNFNIMQAEGNYVHILVPDNTDSDNADDSNPRLVYLRSTDGGASFTNTVVGEGTWYYYGISTAYIKADGNNVAIAYINPNPNTPYIYICRSQDYGATFDTLKVTLPKDITIFGDLQLSGDRWAVVASSESWSYGLISGYVYVATGDMQSEEYTVTEASPELPDSRHLCQISKQTGYNGDDLNYHPNLAITGNQIHVLFTGANELSSSEDGGEGSEANYLQTLYARSDDFGKTWNPAVKLQDTDWSHNMLVAKGQNVYAVVGSGNNRWIAYSNDGGDTWKQNKQMCYGTTCGYYGCNNYDSPRAYNLVIDPTDPTGAHAWYIGAKFLQIETLDGFNSLNFTNRADGNLQSLSGNRGSQFSPVLAIDGEGTNHWLMRHMIGEERNAFHIFYRKDVPEPVPSSRNMALHITELSEKEVTNRLAIPQRPSLQLDSALSVGFWLRIDSLNMSTFVVGECINTPESFGDSQIAGENWVGPGWCVGIDNISSYYDEKTQEFNLTRAFVSAYISTDKSDDGTGKRLYVADHYDGTTHNFAQKGIWHYVTFTWDGRKFGDNAFLYLDGLLVAKASVLGALPRGTNPIIIGEQQAGGAFSVQNWYLDELQIWNRSLSLDEVKALAHHRQVSAEGCIVNYGFDGTLKDLSGNGNDAVAQLNCNFEEYEGLILPEPKMQIAKDWTGRKVTYTDLTENGEAVYWYYDVPGFSLNTSGNGSTQRHTQREFNDWESGVCNPVMIARGQNACAPVYGHVVIGGLNKVEPSVAGQTETVKLKIYGGYEWNPDLNVRLHREGQEDIVGLWLPREYSEEEISDFEKTPYAMFDLSKAETGEWDVIVAQDTLFAGLSVEKFEAPDVWATISGSERMLMNRPKTFYIEYGNRGNVDAYNVPFFLFVSADADITLGFESPLFPEGFDNKEIMSALDTLESVIIEPEGGFGKLRAFSFIIPHIAAGSYNQKCFILKSTNDLDLYYYLGQPWGPLEFDSEGNPIVVDDGSQANSPRRMPQDEWDDIEQGNYRRFNNKQLDCMMKFLGWGTIDAVMGSIPMLGCAYQGLFKLPFQAATDSPEDRWSNLGTNLLTTGFTCFMDFNPVGLAWRVVTLSNIAFSTAMNIYSAKGCMDGSGDGKKVTQVSSYDPNEMIGPSGFGSEHFIKPAPEMSYTITFENKAEATAPAHEVFVTDTLDASVFDFASFGFTTFGWADNSFFVEGQKMKEFVQDINLRPAKQLIVRVSGKFDVEKGIAQWSFVGLNPETKQYEEDPDLGFLVPNNAEHEGEGFVSFSVNHLPELGSGVKLQNEAVIVFDANEAIRTNRFSNTIDADQPESKAADLNVDGEYLAVTWTASDATSGIRKVDVYVSVNNAPFELTDTLPDVVVSEQNVKIPYNPASNYCFATIARDNVGWREAKAETELTCEVEYVPTDVEIVCGNCQDGDFNGVRKVIENDQVVIIRQGKRYNVLGKELGTDK